LEIKLKYVIFLLSAISIVSCGSSGWVKKDGSAVDKQVLNSLLEECKFEERRRTANLYLAGSHVGSKEKRERSKELHEKTYQEALNCMSDKGVEKS
jgi:hypothetical protein